MIKTKKAEALKEGDVLALPMDRTATIKGDVLVGREFVKGFTEHGPSRWALGDEVPIEVDVCKHCEQEGDVKDPLASFWDPSIEGDDKQVLMHGECGTDNGLELA